jgi:phosphomannomutase
MKRHIKEQEKPSRFNLISMDSTLKISISGIRGIPGQSLTPEMVISLGRCFAEYLGADKIVVGRDPRQSGQDLKYQVFFGLSLGGSKIIDLGIVPTPTVLLMVRELKASGGLVLSASHNPLPWNGLKFVNRDGTFFTQEQLQAFLNFFLSRMNVYKHLRWEEVKNVETFHNAIKIHLGKILEKVNVNQIRKRRFRVVLDAGNGAGVVGSLALLEALNCQVFPIFTEQDGTFHRSPEPIAENLRVAEKAVLKHQADLGFGLDPDADRLAVITEAGQAPGEEYTLALVTDFLLGKKVGPVVINLSTSRLIDNVCKKHGAPLFRTRIGEINVVAAAQKNKAVIAGEGNGGVIWPAVVWGRDALSGMALLLNYLAESKLPLFQLIKKLPRYYMIKTTYACSSLEKINRITEQLISRHSKEKINLTEGLKIEGPDWWLHIRGSNTEPVIRIIAETKTRQHTSKLIRNVLKEIKTLDR